MKRYIIDHEYVKVDYCIEHAKIVWYIDYGVCGDEAAQITAKKFEELKKERKILTSVEAAELAIHDKYYDVDLKNDWEEFAKIKSDEFEVYSIYDKKTEETIGYLEELYYID